MLSGENQKAKIKVNNILVYKTRIIRCLGYGWVFFDKNFLIKYGSKEPASIFNIR